jgi:uncharacterized protein (DUF1778 family)
MPSTDTRPTRCDGLDPSVRYPYNAAVRSQRIELRLTDEERQLDGAAASAVGETLSDFFRRAAHTRAQEILAEQQQLSLSAEEAARFLDALERVDEDTVARLRDLRARA